MNQKIVIIGCGAAGWSAAVAARKIDKKAQITIIEQGKYPLYERGGIPFVIQGDIPNFEALVNFPLKYYKFMKIQLQTEAKVIDIDSASKEVTFENKQKKKNQISYNSLIIATGATPFVIPVPGHILPEVFGVRTIEDGKTILKTCMKTKKAVVIGARFVGLETAVALKKNDIEVTVVELRPQILDGILDSELANRIKNELENKGIMFVLGTGISEILGKDHVKAARVGSYEAKADMVIMATGVRGNTEIAQGTGVELGETKLIKVNERMETNIKAIYAAGDCTEDLHEITGKSTVSQLGTNAITQGRVAGVNAAGGLMKNPKILGSCVCKLFDTEIASTGLTEKYAKMNGIDCVSASVFSPTRPKSHPDIDYIRIKLVANRENRKIVGAQIIGKEQAGLRIDMISLAIKKGATINDLMFLDHAYSPLISKPIDPMSSVAEVLEKKLLYS